MLPCNNMSTTPFVSGIAGRMYKIDHVWSASGIWATDRRTGSGCGGGTCPIAGNSWQAQNCRSDSSTLSANPSTDAGCGENVVHGCGE
jgi:hypothetical protein